MSDTVQSIQPRARFALVPFLVAIVVALSIGATVGSIATRAALVRPEPIASTAGWDAQKLAAMQGRQLAAYVSTGVQPWDPQKLAAMSGRQQAEVVQRSSGSR